MIKQPWGLARLPAMTTQPPSAPAEHLAVVHALRVFSESAEHAVDEAGRGVGLHRTDLRALALLMARAEAGEPVTASDLGAHLHLTRASATALVDRLAAAGHVQTGHLLVHTSGRYGVGVMEPVRAHGAIPLAIHPAMTFTGLSLDVARLQDCVFGVTADPVVLPVAQALVVEMGGEPVVVKEADRAAYHLALSHGSNHLVTLTAQARQILETIGVADPERVLRSLMTAALENALTDGDGALTGPVARGDVDTLRTHRETLGELEAGGLSADVRAVWETLARATTDRAETRGTLRADTAARLREVLDGSDDPHDD